MEVTSISQYQHGISYMYLHVLGGSFRHYHYHCCLCWFFLFIFLFLTQMWFLGFSTNMTQNFGGLNFVYIYIIDLSYVPYKVMFWKFDKFRV